MQDHKYPDGPIRGDVTIVGGKHNGAFQSQRQALLNMLLEELATWRSHVDATRCLNPRLVVSRGAGNGRPTEWFGTGELTDYDYRCVLPTQVVFDMGDDGDWERCRAETMAVWETLNDLGVPYWGALSGGKGTHTEVFLRPLWALEHRESFAGCVMTLASERLQRPYSALDVDPTCVAPPHARRLLREYGSPGATGYQKTLWVSGPDDGFAPLPDTRENAYQRAGVVLPNRILHADQPPGIFHGVVRDAVGGKCPQSVDCIRKTATCWQCPASR